MTLCILVGILIAGCGGGSERNTGLEKGDAPKGPFTYAEAQTHARSWAMAIPSGQYSAVMPTGSMEPLIDSSVIPIYVKSDGSDIANGMIVVYLRSDGVRVLHKVAALNDTHFIPDGIANSRYDGWVERSAVRHIVAGMIYTRGQ